MSPSAPQRDSAADVVMCDGQGGELVGDPGLDTPLVALCPASRVIGRQVANPRNPRLVRPKAHPNRIASA